MYEFYKNIEIQQGRAFGIHVHFQMWQVTSSIRRSGINHIFLRSMRKHRDKTIASLAIVPNHRVNNYKFNISII